MNFASIDIEHLCKRLHLANMPRAYRELASRAEKEQWSYRDYLAVLLAEEVGHRQNTRLGRLTHRARFPFLKTIDEYDFTFQSQLRLQMLGSYLGPELVSEGRCLILSGKPGRGKTHLAIAIAYKAIQNGFEVVFTTAASLIEELSNASRSGKLRDALANYLHPHLLVIDEVGYLAYADDAANVLYHVVNARHLKKRPMIFTTNKSLAEWGKVLHDDDLARAIIDRVLERGRHIKLDGPSGRTKHLGLDDDLDDHRVADQVAIISGTAPAEFSEPTPGGSQELLLRKPPKFRGALFHDPSKSARNTVVVGPQRRSV